MARDYYGRTLDEWRKEEPETWPPRVKAAIANSDQFRSGKDAPIAEFEEAVAQRQERLTEIAYRYGDRDERGQPYYGERTRSNLHLLALLTLADLTLKGDGKAASDLARFTATAPELTVRHKIDLATDKDDLLTMKAQVWLGMDANAQKAYLMRLDVEQRTALTTRARELEGNAA